MQKGYKKKSCLKVKGKILAYRSPYELDPALYESRASAR